MNSNVTDKLRLIYIYTRIQVVTYPIRLIRIDRLSDSVPCTDDDDDDDDNGATSVQQFTTVDK